MLRYLYMYQGEPQEYARQDSPMHVFREKANHSPSHSLELHGHKADTNKCILHEFF